MIVYYITIQITEQYTPYNYTGELVIYSLHIAQGIVCFLLEYISEAVLYDLHVYVDAVYAGHQSGQLHCNILRQMQYQYDSSIVVITNICCMIQHDPKQKQCIDIHAKIQTAEYTYVSIILLCYAMLYYLPYSLNRCSPPQHSEGTSWPPYASTSCWYCVIYML